MKKALKSKGGEGGVNSNAQSNQHLNRHGKRRFVSNFRANPSKRKVKFIRIPAERARRFVKAPLTGRNIYAVEFSHVARCASDFPKEVA
jgi:hypothetical protein